MYKFQGLANLNPPLGRKVRILQGLAVKRFYTVPNPVAYLESPFDMGFFQPLRILFVPSGGTLIFR